MHTSGPTNSKNIPLILETPNFGQPNEVWGKEIKILQALTGNLEINKSEEDLQDEGWKCCQRSRIERGIAMVMMACLSGREGLSLVDLWECAAGNE
jgi:hypothetical protein